MKTINLKRMMPIAVFVMGISGAFLTTSMQSDAKVDDLAPVLGFVQLPGMPCGIPVACDTQGAEICRLFDDEGPQAFGRTNLTTCSKIVFRPN